MRRSSDPGGTSLTAMYAHSGLRARETTAWIKPSPIRYIYMLICLYASAFGPIACLLLYVRALLPVVYSSILAVWYS
jgi:hypothetical protein